MTQAQNPMSESMYKPIGEHLIERGLVEEKDVAQALAMQEEVGGLLGQALQRLGSVTEEALLKALSEQLDLPIADPLSIPVAHDAFLNAAAALKLPPSWFIARRAVAWLENPVAADPSSSDEPSGRERPESGVTLHVLAADPLNLELREKLDLAVLKASVAPSAEGQDGADAGPSHENPGTSLYQPDIQFYLAAGQTIDMCLARLEKNIQHGDDDSLADTARLREMAEEAPVIDFVNNLFAVAMKENASDIHVEAFEHSFVVRYRIDGVLHTRQNQSRSRFDAIASRIKLVAGMDIAERRLPQDGRHTIRFAGNDIDLRVSSLPSTWGESLVIRLLRKQTELPDLQGLGLTGRAGDVLFELLDLPNGIVLVTGPTGSGKSTTLYRGLERINDGFRKIITIEDPVEYDIGGVPQIQVKSDIGFDFAKGLRSILRQDPDVIMVGEIRDGETATIAAQAALTGHFVLSTLHTNSSLAAVTRLEDIGLERFLISASVRGLMAQRLVRRLCEHCQTDDDSAEGAAEGEALCQQAVAAGADLGSAMREPARWKKAVGCEACDYTGYKGRIAVFEVAKMDEPLREAVNNGAPLRELFSIARRQGFLTLFEDGLLKARAGQTTLSEIYRVCGAEAG